MFIDPNTDTGCLLVYLASSVLNLISADFPKLMSPNLIQGI